MSIPSRPIRILHVLAALDRGGIGSWLVNVARHVDRRRHAMDFLVNSTRKGAHEAVLEGLGCEIIRCPAHGSPFAYVPRMKRVLAARPRYDVLHTHSYLFGSVDALAARYARIPGVIAHIYPTADWKGGERASLSRRLYRATAATILTRVPDVVLCDSDAAGEGLQRLVPSAIPIRRFPRTLYCGTDFCALEASPEAADDVRRRLGIPPGAPMILTIGRYVPHKNHQALIPIAKTVLEQVPSAVFVTIGEGPGKESFERSVAAARLAAQFRILGAQPDVAPFYGAANLFLFPSLMEGFGLVIVEAAAAGLPIVASAIPGIEEAARAAFAPVLVDPSDPQAFGRAVCECLSRPAADFRPEPALLRPYSIESSVQQLTGIYDHSGGMS